MCRSLSVYRFLAFALLLLLGLIPPATLAAPQLIYDDALAVGWNDYSWATVNVAATSPTYSGSNSIAVTYGAWQGLYLAHAGLSTAGFTKLRFAIHGGGSGGQQLQLYAIRAGDSGGTHGPEIAIPTPSANTWTEVEITLADLAATNTVITGLTWQDSSGGAQPTLYIDEIALVGDESPDGPVLSNGQIQRSADPADGKSGVVVRVQVDDPQGLADVTGVSLDATALGRGTVTLRDDGRSNDGAAADGLYGAVFTVAPGTPAGEHTLIVTAQDQAGHSASLQLGAFAALVSPGGDPVSGLPARPAWGSNAWSETPGQDWQVNSGVPWDYIYQYITYNWYIDGWGGNFVGRFAQQAWDKNYIPVISVYLMLGLPTECGESPACYATKLQNPTSVSNYLAALQEAATQANGAQPVIFHLEPDFYGFMQQYNYSQSIPQPDSPANYAVALNITGYDNNLAGFGRRMIDVIHQAAPNALVAPHASMWATNIDPNNVTAETTLDIAQSTATFINEMGGNEADLLFVEWSDRDAGSGLRPWWDDTNHALPHVNRAVLWENALSAASGKRLILWQVPVGNMALDNTCDHYQDNRVAYAFSHPRDLYEAGVVAVLFGGGAACMTQPATDGGFLQAQGGIAYDPPATPTGLTAGIPTGPSIPLHWVENSEPDLWGYRLSYTPLGGGSTLTTDVGSANAANLLIPTAGSWQVTIAAYDAMGNLSPASATVTVTTTVDAAKIYLPLVQR